MAHPSRPKGSSLVETQGSHQILYYYDISYVEEQLQECDFTKSSGRATHNKHVVVPWAEFAKNPDKYFDQDDTPEGITIKDPSKLRFEELQAIHTMWLNRQEQGKPAFQFQNVLPKHRREAPISSKRKGKAKAIEEYVEIDDDVEVKPNVIIDAPSRSQPGRGESSR
jgi:hypothetical protein